MKNLLLILVLFLQFPACTTGQSWIRLREPGISLGYSLMDEILPEGYAYSPLIMLGSFTIWRKKNWSIYSELQLTKAISDVPRLGPYLPAQTRQMVTDHEFGLNAGIRYQLPIGNEWLISAAIGSGPHYITVDTRRQADGFIFSDNFELGLSYLPEGTETRIHLRSRYRHISNAGLESPNGGIDNLFVVVGFSKVW